MAKIGKCTHRKSPRISIASGFDSTASNFEPLSFRLPLRSKKRRISIEKAPAFVGKGVIALSAEAIKTQIGVSFCDFRKFNAFSRKCEIHSLSFVEGKKRMKAKTRARKLKGAFLSPDLRDHLRRILKS